MRHEYDDEQIFESNKIAARTTGRDWISRFNLRDVRAILDALPEPGNPHPEIEFDEVRKGDRIDVLTIYGNHEILTVEARTDSHLLAMGTQIPAENYAESIRLIDRPVVHPDPAEHQFIRVDGKDYEAIPESGRYKLLGPGLATVHVINRENITEWTELELVPKVVADDDPVRPEDVGF